MLFHHEAGIPAVRQLKIIEEVKKLIDVKKLVKKLAGRKICTNETLTEQTVEKQTKLSKTLRKILSLFSFPLSSEGCGVAPQD